jgi:signal transduction histidine kinase
LQETEEGRQRLEALSRRLVELQEIERSEIARELHDEIGQLLTGLKLMIASSAKREGRENGPSSPHAADHDEMAAIVNELIGRLRDLSMNLRPPMLDEIGLVPTLQWHFERYSTRTKVHVSFMESIQASRFPEEVEIAAFRIVQEALTNVARHAGVEMVRVQVEDDGENLKLVIEDKGRGFEPRTAISHRSAGIIGMQERAHLVGGQLTLESAIPGGTRIAVVLPLRNREEWGEESEQ